MTREEYPQVCDYLKSLLLPENVIVNFNGDRLQVRKPIRNFKASLETLVSDENGIMRSRLRKTEVSIYESLPKEEPSLYEMGLPVVESGDKWHYSIGQKVPLNKDRDNVKPAYLRKLRTLVLNEMYDQIEEDDAKNTWVREGASDPNCSDEAIERVMTLRFTENRGAYTPNDSEANYKFYSQGGTVVSSRDLTKGERENAKRANALQSTSKLCPTAKPYSDNPNADPAEIISEKDWSEGVRNIVNYAKFLGRELLEAPITVSVVDIVNNFQACYGKGRLDFNLRHLGRNWFEQGVTNEVDSLLIHEFGHEYSGNHLSEEYHDALCQLGARLKQLALEKPEELRQYMR